LYDIKQDFDIVGTIITTMLGPTRVWVKSWKSEGAEGGTATEADQQESASDGGEIDE
jgi:hypothetical protein